MNDGAYRAVVDRFEEGVDGRLAVLVVERGRRSIGDLAVDPEQLPEAARHTDAVLDVTVADGELSSATYRPETTRQREERAQSRFDRLSKRPPRADDSETDGTDATSGEADSREDSEE